MESYCNISPSLEAVKINGTYVESLVDGYRTIYASGRESLEKTATLYDATKADGSQKNYTRFPSRTITIGFYLEADTPQEFTERFNKLNTVLNVEKAQFIFADETDKYYVGDAIMNAAVEHSRLRVTGEWQILCYDPFKYSTVETGPVSLQTAYDTAGVDAYDESKSYAVGDMVKHLDGTTAKLYECNADNTSGSWDSSKWDAVEGMAFSVTNTGGYKTYPRFVVDFAEDETDGVIGTDGNSGFVQFAKVLDDETRYRLQFGDDEAELPVISSTFDIDFTKNTLGDFTNASGTTILEFKDDANAGASTSGVKPKYGSQSGWHGSLITKNVAAAADFKLDYTQLISLTNKKQMFGFMAACLDSGGNVVAGVKYTKTGKSGYTGSIDYIIGGEVKKTEKKQTFA